MIKFLAYILPFVLTSSSLCADTPPEIIKSYHKIISLIEQDEANELSAMVIYPLRRQNPLQDIATSKDFISYYSILFDSAFKKKLFTFTDSDIFEHNYAYGLVGGNFDGDIWVNEDGKIIAVNYSSMVELNLKKQVIKNIQSSMYPSVNFWDENILVCKSEELLIRIDRIDTVLRYVSWSHGHQLSDEPDLILFHGVEIAQGTMGGWTWTFINGDWSYVIDDVEICESSEQCGFFLRLYLKDTLKSSTKLKEIK